MKTIRPIIATVVRRGFVHLALAGSITTLLALPSSHAASATWNLNPTDGNWVASGGELNWGTVANTFPGSTSVLTNTDVATFDSSSITTIDINSATLNFGGITFGAAATALSSYTIGATNGNSLFLTGGGSITFAADTTPTATTETINAPLVLEGSYSFTNSNADATNVLNINGAISNGTAGSITLTVGGTNTGNNIVSGVISDGTAGGVTSVLKSAVGTWTFSGNNIYSGVTAVNGGALILTGDNSGASGGVSVSSNGLLKIGSATALGTGTFTLNNSANFDNSTGVPLTLTTNNAQVWGVAGGAGANFVGSNDLNLGTGAVTMLPAAGKAFTLTTSTAGVNLTVGGIVSGAGNFTKGGLGTLIFSGANNFTGTTKFSNGTSGIINYQNGIAFGTNSAITVTSGDTVQVQGNIAGGSLALTLAGSGASNATGALENVSGNNSYAGQIVGSASTTISSDAGTLTLTGGISASTFTVTFAGSGDTNISTNGIAAGATVIKNGTGSLTLSAANAYTGSTTVNLGTVVLNGGSLASTSMTVGNASVTATTGNATFQIDGNDTAAPVLTLKAGDGVTTGQGTLSLVDGTINTLTLSNSGTGNVLTMGSATAGQTSFLNLEVGAASDSIAITTGKLSVAGNVTINLTGLGGLNEAQQTLISAGNASGTSFALTNFTLNTSGNFAGYTVSLANDSSTAGKKLFLNEVANASPATVYWKGTNGDGVWSSFTGGNSNISNFTTDAAGTINANGALAGTTNVIFNAVGATNFANTTLGADTTINSLTFNSTATGSVGIGGTNLLTINASSANGNAAGNGITVASGSGNHTLSTRIALGADQTWTVTDSTSTLTASNQVSGAAALTKAGAGTLVLSGSSNYTGATNVIAGKLIVSGSLNGTTTVDVSSGATLASGASGGAVTTAATSGNAVDIAGTLSPGDTSLAPITFMLATGAKLNFDAGSLLRLDVASGGGSDSVIFGGSAGDWLGGSGKATLALNGSINYSSTYVVFQNVTTTGFTFANITGYDSAHFTPTFAFAGNDYTLSFVAVPEPRGLVPLVGGVAMLLGLRRPRRSGWRVGRA